jgi:hypothetical protein
MVFFFSFPFYLTMLSVSSLYRVGDEMINVQGDFGGMRIDRG